MEAAEVLLEAGANVNALDHHANTAIMIGSALGHARVLETLCSAHSADLNTQVSWWSLNFSELGDILV